MQTQSALDEILERHDFRGMGSEFDQMVMQPYKERNNSPALQDHPGMTDAERIEMMQQREPVIVDPNWSANMRQRLVKIDIEGKKVDPNFSVYKNPKTARLANWIARETGPLTPGYMQSGPQVTDPEARNENDTMGMLRSYMSGTVDYGISALAGLVNLGALAVKGIAGEAYGLPWAVATNYVEDADGNLVNNGGKIPGFLQVVAAVNARVLGQDVREYVARVGEAEEFDRLQESGFESVTRGLAHVIGLGHGAGPLMGGFMSAGKALTVGGRLGGGSASISAFGKSVGFTLPSMEVSGLMHRGLLRMATSGASPRMVKLTKVLAGGAGASVGNGVLESVAFGNVDGYGKAFIHGMAMGPVFLALGALGRKSESILTRKKMPEGLARTVSGGIEGFGFGTLEAAQIGALWKLMQDPTNETWEIYAKNMLGFAIFKGAFGHSVVQTPEFGEAQGANMLRQGARERLAEDVSRTDEQTTVREADDVIVQKTRAEEQADLEMRTGVSRETVEGREPTVPEGQRGEYQIKGKLPNPEESIKQAQRGELDEGTMVRNEDVLAERGKKGEQQGFDPLEDPNFASRPEAERRAILERRDPAERRRVAEEDYGGAERREGERREMLTRREEIERRRGKVVGEDPRDARERGGKPVKSGPESAGRLSARELANEIQRIRGQGFTPENRARINELLAQERGRMIEGMGEGYRRMGEQVQQYRESGPPKAPVTEYIRRRETAEERVAREDLDARVEASGIPREILRELGDISRARRAARTPQESARLWRRQAELEQELDALEMSQDPVMNATMREAIRRRELEELDTIEEVNREVDELQAPATGEVDPLYGERRGPESMRKEANPHRQQENLLRPGEEPIRASDIINVLKGRAGFPGVRIFGRRLGRIPGSAVQVAVRAGRTKGKGTAGVFKLFENLTRTKEGMDLVVSLHEWAHAMQRQVHVGFGGPKLSRGVKDWIRSLPDEVLDDMGTILRSYPGADKLPIWVVGSEAWAEWHARNLLGDPTLRAEVPHLTRWMDAWLKGQPHLMQQYREVHELVDVYKRQGSRLRLRESIQRGLPRQQGKLVERTLDAGEKVWDSVVKSFFDDMHLLKKSMRKWLAVSDVSIQDLGIMDNPARVYDAVVMTASKQAESFIRRGTHNLSLERTGEGLEAIMNDVGGDLKGRARNEKTIDFIDYVVGTRAIDLIGKGRKQTLPLSDYIQATKELIEANPEFAGLSKRLKRWSDALLDLVAEAGNVPAVDVQRMKDFSVVYLPFVRAMDGVVSRRGNRGVAEQGNALKSLKGDTREISDPMQAMFDTTTTMIAKAHQQMVMKALYKVTLRADVGGLATRIPRKNVPANYRLDQVVRQMQDPTMRAAAKDAAMTGEVERFEKLGEAFDVLGELAKEGMLSDEMVTLFGQKLLPFGEGANIIAYTPRLTTSEIDALPKHRQADAERQNGKMQWLEVDQHAYSALMGLDQPVGPTFMDHVLMKIFFGYPYKAVRFFATDANPVFMAANSIRDMSSASVFDSEGKIRPFHGYKKFFAGAAMMIDAHRGGPSKEMVDMYDASGARTASIYNEGVRREMRGEVVGKMALTREAIQKAVGWYTNKLAAPESFIRVHEFARVHKKAIAEGKSGPEAALEALEAAKEITVNFARAGTVARAWNQMTPYFSASFAGQRKLLRAITGMEGTTDAERARLQAAAISNGMVGITAPAMVVWALTSQEDWYKDLPEWRKKHFVNFKLPGTDNIISLPLPFELGSIFATMPAILGDQLTDGNPVPFWSTLAESMFPYLNGLGGALPAGAKPFLEAASGYDFFTRKEQTPFWIEQNNPPEEQMRPGTSIMAKEAFYLFNKFTPDFLRLGIDNPIELEQFLSGYTAGASTSFFRWVDETASLKDHPGMRPGIEGAYGAFLNRFARQTPHGSSRMVDQFYNQLVPSIEQRARGESTRTPALRRSLKTLSRDKERMADIRKRVRDGSIDRIEGDRLIYEIARDAIDREAR